MHETPLATSSPIRSKIKQMAKRKAKNSRRSISLLDVSAIDANPDVFSHISESNETLASGYRDSGYVRSDASSLEEDDSKASKDLFEELKFKDVLICELQESNRGLRMRCADAENKIFRLRVKCQSHCAGCQGGDVLQSPNESAGEDKDEASSSINGKHDFLSHDLFRFKHNNLSSSSSNDLNLSLSHDRLAKSRNRLASFSGRGNASLSDSCMKLLTRSKSSETIGTQTPVHRSSPRTDDQSARKLVALKVQRWQKEYSLKDSPSDDISDRGSSSSRKAAVLSSKRSHPHSRSHSSLPQRTSKFDRVLNHVEIAANGEASLLSAISERDSSVEVDVIRRVLIPDLHLESLSSPSSPESLLMYPQSTPFADITNQRATTAYEAKSHYHKASRSQEHSMSPQYISDLGFEVDGRPKAPKDQRTAESASANFKFPGLALGPATGGCEHLSPNYGQFAAREQPCGHCRCVEPWSGHCRCVQPSPVIIVPSGCCCTSALTRLAPIPPHTHQHCEATSDTSGNQSRLRLDVSTDSSDLHPIFEIKSKTASALGKCNFPATSGFDSKTEHQTICKNDRDCKCSSTCSGSAVPLATRFDAKAEYKRKIEEGMKKIASDARAETESLKFQPWASPDSPEMSPIWKLLAESSNHVNQMAITVNSMAARIKHETGILNPVNPSP